MGSHSVTCHPADVTFMPLPQLIKAGTRFIDPVWMQGWVRQLVWSHIEMVWPHEDDHPAAQRIYTVSQKTTLMLHNITSTHINWFWWFWAEMLHYRMVISYLTSWLMSLHYMWKHEPQKLSFQLCCVSKTTVLWLYRTAWKLSLTVYMPTIETKPFMG